MRFESQLLHPLFFPGMMISIDIEVEIGLKTARFLLITTRYASYTMLH